MAYQGSIKRFGIANDESLFMCSESNATPLQLFHEPYKELISF